MYKYLEIEKTTSLSSKYLIAKHSVSKGDYYAASKILDVDITNYELLKLKFLSNLANGNFIKANNISKLITSHSEKEKSPLYILPKYILNLKNDKLKENVKILDKNENFFGLKRLNPLIKLWLQNKEKKVELVNLNKRNIYELLILENFHNPMKLEEIADYIYKNNNLNQNEYFFLAGFYYRLKNFTNFNNIVNSKLTNQFDKKFIIRNFSDKNNIYNQKPSFLRILSAKLYSDTLISNKQDEKSKTFQKVLLEASVFLCPEMDIAKYSLAEIYSFESLNKMAFSKLELIGPKSFYFLASNLKKLSILKSSKKNNEYSKLLFKISKIWPTNEYILYELANYYKSKDKYNHSLSIYKNLIEKYGEREDILFSYATNLDMLGRWQEAKPIFFKILEKKPNDSYTLNYISYKLALKEEELDLALDLIKRALSIDPDNGYFLDTLGWVEFKRKNYSKAVFFLEKSVSILPKSFEVLDHLGDCYLKLNRKAEAIYEWNKAIKYTSDKKVIDTITRKIANHE